jgi:hypothetical protein
MVTHNMRKVIILLSMMLGVDCFCDNFVIHLCFRGGLVTINMEVSTKISN